MALIHAATLSPSKREVLDDWVPRQQWAGGARTLDVLGAYRFDDPDGAVGIETFLIASGGIVLHVPLTYRDAPLVDGEDYLVATMEHSVLGTRWVYDAVGDPVYAAALARAILTGGAQADLNYNYDAPPEKLVVNTRVTGSGQPGIPVPEVGAVEVTSSGTASTIRSEAFDIDVARVVDVTASVQVPVLTGTWPGQDKPAVLALVRGS